MLVTRFGAPMTPLQSLKVPALSAVELDWNRKLRSASSNAQGCQGPRSLNSSGMKWDSEPLQLYTVLYTPKLFWKKPINKSHEKHRNLSLNSVWHVVLHPFVELPRPPSIDPPGWLRSAESTSSSGTLPAGETTWGGGSSNAVAPGFLKVLVSRKAPLGGGWKPTTNSTAWSKT